jgi:hypothetical protein
MENIESDNGNKIKTRNQRNVEHLNVCLLILYFFLLWEKPFGRAWSGNKTQPLAEYVGSSTESLSKWRKKPTMLVRKFLFLWVYIG